MGRMVKLLFGTDMFFCFIVIIVVILLLTLTLQGKACLFAAEIKLEADGCQSPVFPART
jgi:hypothetical protein